MSGGSETLRAALRQRGGELSELATGPAHDRQVESGPPQLAVSGPRTAGREAEYELLLEMILEGSRLHYGGATVVLGADPDLALLLGDQLYAVGLSRLAALGDLEAVSELADVISLVAQAQADPAGSLAADVWDAGAAAIGWGGSEEYEQAKVLARAGDPRAASALRAAAASSARRRLDGSPSK